jgi:hypothetical protein
MARCRPHHRTAAAGTAQLPPDSKFNVMGKGQFRDQQGVVRQFLITPEMFK